MRALSSTECSCSLRCSVQAERLGRHKLRHPPQHALHGHQEQPARLHRSRTSARAELQMQAPAGGPAAGEGLAAWLEERGLPANKRNAAAVRGDNGMLQLVTARPVARYCC